MMNITIGTLPDGSQKTIDLDEIHTMLIAGGTDESRERLLCHISLQVGRENIKMISSRKGRGSIVDGVRVAVEDYDIVSCWRAALQDDGADRPALYVIDDYAEYLYSEGIVSKQVRTQFRKDVLFLAQYAKAINICLILICGRPCADALTSRLKCHFQCRISFKTKNRIDSYSILDEPSAAVIEESQFIYSDGEKSLVLNRLQF